MVKTSLIGALAVSGAAAATYGFNTGATALDGSVKDQAIFEAEFNAAKKLAGTDGAFTASRLYTMIQGTTGGVIEAIPAALKTNTDLLLGMWASGTDNIDKELNALKQAMQQYPDLAKHCVGISVGSEDLYRNSPTGIANKAGIGAEPALVAKFINQVKDAIKGSPLSNCPVGHVDTWTAWQNATANQAVLDAVDWVGTDGYPYFQTQSGDNSIEHAAKLFFDSVDVVKSAVGGKPVWVAETGFPWKGPTVGQAVPSKENAKTYWDEVYCKLKSDNVNTFWYTLDDANSADKATFGVLGGDINGQPVYDLSCKNVKKTPTSSSSSSSSPSSSAAPKSSGGAGIVVAPHSGMVTSASATPASSAGAHSMTGTPSTASASNLPSSVGGNNSASPSSTSGATGATGGSPGSSGSNVPASANTPSGAFAPSSTGPSMPARTGAAAKVSSGSLAGFAAAAIAGLFFL